MRVLNKKQNKCTQKQYFDCWVHYNDTHFESCKINTTLNKSSSSNVF